jgi:hypothetical protein
MREAHGGAISARLVRARLLCLAAASLAAGQTGMTSFNQIQILTVDDLFDGKRPVVPWTDQSVFKKAKREKSERQSELDL